jgi:hypothetical protein
MQFSPLSIVKDRITVGRPLPFNVRDADRTLLLARGQVIATQDQLIALFRRGALVDLAELQRPEDKIRRAAPGELPGLWAKCLDTVADSLRQSGHASFVEALEDVTPSVMALVERDKDLAIFQVLRQGDSALVEYGVNHSMHAAIASYLVAQRLGWSSAESQRAFKAALTMNISMLELQGQLAAQPTPRRRCWRWSNATRIWRSSRCCAKAAMPSSSTVSTIRCTRRSLPTWLPSAWAGARPSHSARSRRR